MREALVGFTTDREFTCAALHFVQRRCHPAPKVKYFVVMIITQLRLDDAFNRADGDALRRIMMTDAFDTGLLVDDIDSVIAFTDGLSRAFR